STKVEKIATPGHFDGDKKEYDDWRDNIIAYLEANTKAYADDKVKFLYVTSLLRGITSGTHRNLKPPECYAS
ncbi:hypothetical protein JAAARDRAFT_85384, partial [Jaapia argillacea MUCL 33604]